MPWQDVCLSVCLSVRHTPVLCLNGYTYPQSFFHCWVAPPFYFFHTKRDGNIPTGTHNEGAECKGDMKNHDFRPISGFISVLMQDKAIVTIEGE